MHTRFLWAVPLILSFLALPGPALAAPDDFKFTVLRNVCRDGGGDFGNGHQVLKVRVEEHGLSGANKFTLDARVRHRKASGGQWQTEYTWDRFKVKFPNDDNSYYHTRWFSYDPNDKGLHKIVVVIRVWHNRQVLASRTIVGKTC